jgi:hypothetical protein
MIRPQKFVIAGLDPAIYEASPTVEAHHGLPGLAPSARPGNDEEGVIYR